MTPFTIVILICSMAISDQSQCQRDTAVIFGFIEGLVTGETAERDWRQDQAWICSEEQAAGFVISGAIKPFPDGTLCITPWDLFNKLSDYGTMSLAHATAAKAIFSVKSPF